MGGKFSKYLSIKSVLAFSALNYLQAGVSFIVSYILARELGKEQYGLYVYGIVFANTFSVLIQFGMERTLVRDLVQLDRPTRILSAATALKGIMSLIIVIPTFIWVWFIGGFSEPKILVVTFSVLSGTLWGISPKAWFDAEGKIHLNAVISLLDRLFFLITSLYIVFYLNEINSVVVYITVMMFLGRLISGGIEWVYVFKNVDFDFSEIKTDINLLILENKWVWLAGIGNMLMTQANQIILEAMEGTGQLGLYGFAFQLIMLIRLLQSQLLRLTTPAIADITQGKSKSELKAKLTQYCLLSFILTIILVIPLYLTAPFLIATFVGESFLPCIPILNVLLIWISLYGVAIINIQFLISFRLQQYYFYITVTFGLLSLILSKILIERYLGQGAALSLLFSSFAAIIVQFILVINRINKSDLINSKE